MKKQPLVSILIVTYNSEEYLHECLTSVFKNSYRNYEVIVFDNNSTDKTKEIIQQFSKSKKNNLRTHFSKINHGYAKANNKAAEMSRGKYIFFLNPDTIVDKSFLNPLVSTAEHSSVAAVQPLVYLFDKKTINLTGKLTHFLGFDWLKDFKSTRVPKQVSIYSLSGSGVLVNKKIFNQVRGFDENYFMYYEDSDLSWKFNLIGKKIIFCPNSILYHDYKYIPNENYQPLKQKLFYIERNRILTIFKNYSLRTLLLLLPSILFMEAGMVCFAFLSGWGGTKLSTYFSILKTYDSWKKERTIIQGLRKISDKQIFHSMEPKITFEKFENIVIRALVNPVLYTYYKIVQKLI